MPRARIAVAKVECFGPGITAGRHTLRIVYGVTHVRVRPPNAEPAVSG